MPEVPEEKSPKPVEAGTTEAAAAAPKPAPPPPKPAPVPWESDTVEQLQQMFGPAILDASSYLGQNYLVVERGICYSLLALMNSRFGYNVLADLTAVHYPKDPLPFEMVWILYSMKANEHVRVKARFAEGEEAPSITDLWVGANWLEREVFDMFGIRFAGHPDLRRILLPEDWQGFPLRKDYGLQQQDAAWVKKNLGIESGR